MNETLRASAISAVINLAGENQLPDNIQWMPPGRHTVYPSVEGKATKMTLDVTAELAARFNKQLQDLRADAADGVEDEPYLDFNHEDRERAAEVLELYWGGDDAKAGGIRARVKWSDAGKSAVLGRSYRRFSPSWAFDKKTFEPVHIETNLGGLVNRAAFRTIAPVVAKGDSAANHNSKNKMTDQEIQEAISNGLARAMTPFTNRLAALETNPARGTATAAATGAAETAALIGTAVSAALKPLTDKLDNAEKNTVKANAKAAIQPHIQREAIAPGDTATITFWENAWIADAKAAEAQMARLPGKKASRVLTSTARSEADTTPTEPDAQIMEAAASMAEKSNGKFSKADALIAYCRTGGQEAYKEFRSTWMEQPAKESRN
jgi:hypothetical protein